MTQTLTINISLDELSKLITDAVKKALSEYPVDKEINSEIIDTYELCKRLNVTAPTVLRWRKKGKIPVIEIGSAVRFDYSKVLEALETK